jgi:ribosome-binding protein aMBF1 (putative translation factor)
MSGMFRCINLPLIFKQLRSLSGIQKSEWEIPSKIESVGDHLRNVRIQRKITRKELAKQFQTKYRTVVTWELNQAEPALKYMKDIVQFLEYIPFDFEDAPLPERLKIARLINGLSFEKLSSQINIEANSLCNIELGNVKPRKETIIKLEAFIHLHLYDFEAICV